MLHIDSANGFQTRLLVVDMALCPTVTITSGSEESGITRLVTIRFALVLGMLTRRQCLVALLALETLRMPVFAERCFLLGEIYFFLTSRTLWHVEAERR